MSDSDMLKIILEKVTSLDDRVSTLDNKVSSLDNKVSSLDGELKSVKNDVNSIKLTLETETNRNIKIIAEGHIDVMNKLNDVLKVENEKELMLIRLNTLENEVRKIKEIISA